MIPATYPVTGVCPTCAQEIRYEYKKRAMWSPAHGTCGRKYLGVMCTTADEPLVLKAGQDFVVCCSCGEIIIVDADDPFLAIPALREMQFCVECGAKAFGPEA